MNFSLKLCFLLWLLLGFEFVIGFRLGIWLEVVIRVCGWLGV